MEKLEGAVRAYPWGSRTLIPQLRGEAEPSGRPVAEIWYGAHPGAPAQLLGTTVTLDRAIAAAPQAALGERVLNEFGPQLPFLLKLLAADEPLSLQAHPSKAQAEEGFARDNAAGLAPGAANRNYRDDNHKPELIVALTPFQAMAGFRPLNRTLELFNALACPAAERYLTMLDPGDPESSLRGLFTTWITIPGGTRRELIAAVIERAQALSERPDWIGRVCATVVELHDRYPFDVGVLGALLLNHLWLQPGEAIYLAAGELHAYVRGMGVEIMANSDNVLRGGLTAKYVDVPELVRVLNFHTLEAPQIAVEGTSYPVPAQEFQLDRIEINAPGWRLDHDGPSIVMCTSGVVHAAGIELNPGEAAWVPASEPPRVFSGAGEVFWARA